MPRPGLTPEQNERVRGVLRDLLQRDFEGSQSALARKLGVRQPMISRILSRETGTTYPIVQKLARLSGQPEWRILGTESPLTGISPRELGAELAREVQISDRAIAAVLDEPVTPDREWWRALTWANYMQRKELDLLPHGPAVFVREVRALEEQPRRPALEEAKPRKRARG
jgi:transcriptional regulator with XRE-family HTH domain